MTKSTSNTQAQDTGMMLALTYKILFLSTAVTIYLANMLSPGSVVLGTMSLTPLWAVVLSSGVVSLIATLVLPFLNRFERQRDNELSPAEMMAFYFAINFVSLWLITRASDVFGLGLSSWLVTLVLALIVNLIQGVAMVATLKLRQRVSL
ncbi:MAG: hypothetical protein M3Q81_04860 [bacterium]|nr:hypothetical protein [bacterium]